jgi:hypothetical protein
VILDLAIATWTCAGSRHNIPPLHVIRFLDHSCTAAQPFRAHSDGVYVVHTVIDSYRREKKAKVKLDAKQLNALTGKCSRGKVGKEGEGTTATH